MLSHLFRQAGCHFYITIGVPHGCIRRMIFVLINNPLILESGYLNASVVTDSAETGEIPCMHFPSQSGNFRNIAPL